MGPNVPGSEENSNKCLCPSCPTYKSSNLNSNLFCARGKATKAVTRSGCSCPQCPVATKYGLTQMYYCIQGKSVDLK